MAIPRGTPMPSSGSVDALVRELADLRAAVDELQRARTIGAQLADFTDGQYTVRDSLGRIRVQVGVIDTGLYGLRVFDTGGGVVFDLAIP